VVDWHEVWGRDYWRSYLGSLRGRIGFAVERVCLRLPDHSFTFSRLAERSLRELGHRAPVTRLTGEFAADEGQRQRLLRKPREGPPLVVFAGRHISEKRVPAIPPAIAAARRQIPELRCLILGDGPDAAATRAEVEALGLRGAIEMPGRVPPRRWPALLPPPPASFIPPSARATARSWSRRRRSERRLSWSPARRTLPRS
jgi:glycosyltransferase involved in cell wall biosynthesis